MKIEEYRAIVRDVRNYRGLTRDCARMLVAKYASYSTDTLYSILGQEITNKMKLMHRKLQQRSNESYLNYLEAVKRQEPDGILMRTAMKLDICPALLARKILEQYYEGNEDVTKEKISQFLRDTTLIKDAKLAYEIYLCIVYDDQYGYISNACSESVGEEYEVKLELCLKKCKIPFYDENHLRTKGYDKTPDFKLEVPIAVNGFVVNWIESKARFGGPDVHEHYIKEQFLSYWNRFGPGLVIYWFGFVDSIIQSSETRFIIMDHFPENITYMDPSSIRQTLL